MTRTPSDGEPDNHLQHLVTVDLVAKKEVARVTVKDNTNIAILAVVAC